MPPLDDRHRRHAWGDDGRVDPDDIAPDDEEEAVGPGAPHTDVFIRAFSVIPFLLLAAIGLISCIGWAIVIIFGVGSAEPVWQAVRGLSFGELLWQVLLAVLIGLAPLAVTLAASWATSRGFQEESGRTFWTVAESVWGALALGLVYVRTSRPDLVDLAGLTTIDWWFGFGVVAFAMILAGVRLRRAPRSTTRRR